MKNRRSICISDDTWETLKKISKKESRSLSSMIEVLIKQYNEKQK